MLVLAFSGNYGGIFNSKFRIAKLRLDWNLSHSYKIIMMATNDKFRNHESLELSLYIKRVHKKDEWYQPNLPGNVLQILLTLILYTSIYAHKFSDCSNLSGDFTCTFVYFLQCYKLRISEGNIPCSVLKAFANLVMLLYPNIRAISWILWALFFCKTSFAWFICTERKYWKIEAP